MELDKITIRGAKENNLKNISLEIPRNKMVVMTGLSGSGKTSLAFDTIYAEGQRRYVESLSAYARQFLGGVEKPNVELIEGFLQSDNHDWIIDLKRHYIVQCILNQQTLVSFQLIMLEYQLPLMETLKH